MLGTGNSTRYSKDTVVIKNAIFINNITEDS